MACDDPRCHQTELPDFYCQSCGEGIHTNCCCICWRVTCPQCQHIFVYNGEYDD